MSGFHPFPSNITNDEINALPLGAFEGPVEVISEVGLLRKAFEEIRRHTVVGFDTETRPVFVRGQHHHVALLQIALPQKVYIIRLNLTGIPEEMIHFLEDPKVVKVGIALRDDIKAMQRLKRFKPEGFFELTELTRRAAIEAEGLKKLAAIVLGFRVSKSAQTSNWEAEELNEKQILYAATDAWVCLEVYRKVRIFLREY